MEPGDLGDLYRDTILDHCRKPRNKDKLEDHHIVGRAVNPFCGDEVHVQIVLDGERVTHVGVRSTGCVINRASTLMLSEAVDYKSLEEIEILAGIFEGMMNGANVSQQDLEELGDLKVSFRSPGIPCPRQMRRTDLVRFTRVYRFLSSHTRLLIPVQSTHSVCISFR